MLVVRRSHRPTRTHVATRRQSRRPRRRYRRSLRAPWAQSAVRPPRVAPTQPRSSRNNTLGNPSCRRRRARGAGQILGRPDATSPMLRRRFPPLPGSHVRPCVVTLIKRRTVASWQRHGNIRELSLTKAPSLDGNNGGRERYTVIFGPRRAQSLLRSKENVRRSFTETDCRLGLHGSCVVSHHTPTPSGGRIREDVAVHDGVSSTLEWWSTKDRHVGWKIRRPFANRHFRNGGR